MKITICGSIAFYEEMQAAEEQLEALGHEALIPPDRVPDKDGNIITVAEFYKIRKAAGDKESWVWDVKEQAIRLHFDKIADSDAILVLNEKKNDIPGYIGANTFLEMGLACYLRKPIYVLHQIPDQGNIEEIMGMKPILLHGDVNNI